MDTREYAQSFTAGGNNSDLGCESGNCVTLTIVRLIKFWNKLQQSPENLSISQENHCLPEGTSSYR